MATKKKSTKTKSKKKKTPANEKAGKSKITNSPFQKVAPGQPNWHGLSTPNDKTAATFYEKVLGVKSESMTMGPETMIMLKAGKEQIAHLAPVGPGESPRWVVFFYAPDVDKAAKICEQNGGQIVMPPGDIPPGRIAFLKDPAGAEFAVFKPRG